MVLFDPIEGHEFALRAKYYYDKTGLRKARIEEVDPGRNSSHRYVHVIELFSLVRSLLRIPSAIYKLLFLLQAFLPLPTIYL